jgi:alpha-galactosidase
MKQAQDPAVFVRSGAQAGVRFASGPVVLDEAFQHGRLVTRYWSTAGQVVPEMYAEKVAWAHDEPADGFRVAVDGRDLAGGWAWTSAAEELDASGLRGNGRSVKSTAIRLTHAAAGAEVTVHTRLDGSPFVARWLEITNRSSKPFSLTSACPFGGMLWSQRIDEHMAPGAASPFELAWTHLFAWGEEGDVWFETLPDGVKTVDGGRIGRSGWGRPAFWARDAITGQTVVCELAWSGNYEFSLDCRVRKAAKQAKLFFRMGLSAQEKALRVLAAGETVRTPAVHLGFFHAETDAIVHATHEHVRHTVMPAQVKGRHVEIEANHRGYLCDRENEPDLKRDAEVAAAIGAEIYVIDAGWYGNDPNQWWNNTGDWTAGSWLPNGLEPVVAHAKKLGMKFGLWVEIEAAGANSTLQKTHPEWLLPGRKITGHNRALDFSNPEVVRWAEGEIERIIRQYGLDMYRIDHNHVISPAGSRPRDGYDEDLTWRYYDGFAGMFQRLRAKFPTVVFQNCAGGGGRLDWGTLSLFHNTELSDWMRQPRGLRILNGVTLSLPPEILLRTFGTEVPEHELDGDIDAQLRMVCLCRPIFRGIAPSVEELTPYLAERIRHHLDLYRTFIRPVMIDGCVFHHTPFQPVYGRSAWCVLEYAAKDGGRSVAGVFRTSPDGGAEEIVVRPRGLRSERTYTVRLDSAGQSWKSTGADLARDGVRVRLPSVMSSELVLFDAER